MGWSCRKEAGDVLNRVFSACRKDSGSQNVHANKMIETDSVEYVDGAITGVLFQMLPGNTCREIDTFRIEGDGKISKGPEWFRLLAK